MNEEKMTFPAMQDKFFRELIYYINIEQAKAGYSDVDYEGLIKVLEDALPIAYQLKSCQEEIEFD